MLKAVIDTNIIVSGLISAKSSPGIIIDNWLFGKFIPIISNNILEEISLTLQKPQIKRLIEGNISLILTALVDKAELVEIKKFFNVCQDIDDNILFDAAYAAQADFIVSGDKKVLKVKDFYKIQVIGPEYFLEKFSSSFQL